MAEQTVAEVLSFPTDPSQFDQDHRISFSRLDNKYIAVQESDGTEFEFDAQLKRWIPSADEDEEALIQMQQSAYGAPDPTRDARAGNGKRRREDDLEVSCARWSIWSRRTTIPPHEPASIPSLATIYDDRDGQTAVDVSWGEREKTNKTAERQPRFSDQMGFGDTLTHAPSLLQDQDNNGGTSSTQNKRKTKKQATQQKQPPQNRAVYVTGLPLDVTVDEVADVFSHKCGVIAEEMDSGRPRIKLYTDTDGKFKGDALVVFFKPQSVDMAIMLLDDTHFRYSDSGLGSGKMRVQAADTSYKKVQEGDGAHQKQSSNHHGDHKDREKAIKKAQKMSAKLADWSDDEPAYIPPEQRTSKKDKMVILKHMFTMEELEEDPAALLEIKEDIREECEKLGEVTNVVLYDLEPEGIVSIKFRRPESAEECVQMMDGRNFGGQKVEAFIPTGRLKFKRSKDNNDDAGEED